MPVRQLKYIAISIALCLLCLSPLACNKTETEDKPKSKSRKITAPKPRQEVETVLPEPELTPEQVVKRQLEAIRASNGTSDGLAAAFEFSSAAHRDKMAVLIRAARYQALLNFEKAEFGPARIEGMDARQIVSLYDDQGQVRMFLFDLRRQTSGPDKGRWLIEAVHPGALDISSPFSESSDNSRAASGLSRLTFRDRGSGSC